MRSQQNTFLTKSSERDPGVRISANSAVPPQQLSFPYGDALTSEVEVRFKQTCCELCQSCQLTRVLLTQNTTVHKTFTNTNNSWYSIGEFPPEMSGSRRTDGEISAMAPKTRLEMCFVFIYKFTIIPISKYVLSVVLIYISLVSLLVKNIYTYIV